MMEFNSDEEWIKYVGKIFLERNKDEQMDFNIDFFNKILEKVPKEFHEDDFFKNLKECFLSERSDYLKSNKFYCNTQSITGVSNVTINSIINIEGNHTIEKSILNDYMLYIECEPLEFSLCAWLEETINMFNYLIYFFELNIIRSIDAKQLIKKEVNSLEMFFNSGNYDSSAIHGVELAEGILYKYYNNMLFGANKPVIGLEELSKFQKTYETYNETPHKKNQIYLWKF